MAHGACRREGGKGCVAPAACAACGPRAGHPPAPSYPLPPPKEGMRGAPPEWRAHPSSVATISFPTRSCATPRAAQKSYSMARPSTHMRALRLPAG